MKNIFKIKNLVTIMFVLVFSLVFANTVFAETPNYNPNIYNNAFGTGQLNYNTQTTYTTTRVCAGTGLSNLICTIQGLINSIIPLLIGLGLILFIWGIVQYVIGDSEEAKTKGRDHMIWGIIGFTVIVSVWGIVNFVVNTFLPDGAQSIAVPVLVPTSTSALSANTCNLPSSPKFQDITAFITCNIQNFIIPLIFALSMLFFLWGVFQYVISDSEEAKTKGRDHMIWGVIALTVMLSIWGIVGVLGDTFGLNTNFLPSLKTSAPK